MTLVVVAVLVIAWTWWGVVTLRDRRHSTGGRVNSIASFNNHLSVLERSSPATRGLTARSTSMSGPVGPYRPQGSLSFTVGSSIIDRLKALVAGSAGDARSPIGGPAARTMTLSEAQQRRRKMIGGLGVALVVSAFLALVVGWLFVQLTVLVVLAAVAYVGLLLHARRVEIERSVKVRNIATARAGTAGLVVVDESVNRGFGQAYGQGYGNDYGRSPESAYGVSDGFGTADDVEPAYAGYAN